MPSAKMDSDTAAISRRYSRIRNGASTRQPPASRTGCWISNCVLTDRWSPINKVGVQRFSVLGVGEVRLPAILEGACAFAEIGGDEQRHLALGFAADRGLELG